MRTFWPQTPHKYHYNVPQLLVEGVGVLPREENVQLYHTMVDSGDLLLYNYICIYFTWHIKPVTHIHKIMLIFIFIAYIKVIKPFIICHCL